MLRKFVVMSLTAGLLAGCSGQMRGAAGPQPRLAETSRTAPSQEDYVWARNDGRRMTGNPELLAKGQADKDRCTAAATTAVGLDLTSFVRCMEAAGYTRRNV